MSPLEVIIHDLKFECFQRYIITLPFLLVVDTKFKDFEAKLETQLISLKPEDLLTAKKLDALVKKDQQEEDA